MCQAAGREIKQLPAPTTTAPPRELIYMPQFPNTKPTSDNRLGFNSFLSSLHHKQSDCILLLTSHPITHKEHLFP